jgi:hypothetical protein
MKKLKQISLIKINIAILLAKSCLLKQVVDIIISFLILFIKD